MPVCVICEGENCPRKEIYVPKCRIFGEVTAEVARFRLLTIETRVTSSDIRVGRIGTGAGFTPSS
jgi:hypothetical protein